MLKVDLNTIDAEEILPGFRVKVVHSEHMTLTHWDIKAGSSLPEHSHPHEQVTNMIEGELELIVDGESNILKPNSVVVIPSNATHSGKAITGCRVIDVFYPTREDYR
ncbi:MAG: cupin domain-containing protein [Fidelibacterota bacterium]